MNRYRSVLVVAGVLMLQSLAPAAHAAAPQPLTPGGTIQDKTPVFKWSDTGAGRYTLKIVKDQDTVKLHTITDNRYKSSFSFDAGVYTWRVKEGRADEATPWSEPLTFTLLPQTPIPVSPSDWLNLSATNPLFRWSSSDFEITRFTLQLFQGSDLLGSVTAPGFKSILSCSWTSSLPVGAYSWRIRSLRDHANPDLKIQGAWSAKKAFSIGIALPPVITTPFENALYGPGSFKLTAQWTPAPGSTHQNIKLIRNGQSISNVISASTSYGFSSFYSPGYYALAARSFNGYGYGPWSEPRNFEVIRYMEPDARQTVPSTPLFTWNQSLDGTGFVVRLFKYSQSQGKFTLFRTALVPSIPSPSWAPDPVLPDGIYRWSVTDYRDNEPLYSSFAYFQVQVPGLPTIQRPHNTTFGQRDLEFAWKPPATTVEKYQVQVFKGAELVKDSGWTNFPIKGIPEVYTTFSFPAVPADYSWRVRARNKYGIGPWNSAPFSLVPVAAPEFPGVLYGEHHPGDLFTFQWYPVNLANRYQVRILNKNGAIVGGGITPSVEGPAIKYSFTVGPIGPYTLKVRAGSDGWGPWSTYSFRVRAP